MLQWNNGQTDELQIRFTGYLIVAVKRRRKDYMNHQARRNEKEIPVDEVYAESPHLEEQVMDILPLMDTIGSRALLHALEQLNERERYVFLGRALDGYSFEELGARTGLSYKGVAAVYYRAIRKIKKLWKEVDKHDF